nr:hypothetical protein [uncultured Campylobacter sp.]
MNEMIVKEADMGELDNFKTCHSYGLERDGVNLTDTAVKSGAEILRDARLANEGSKLFKCTVDASKLSEINGKFGSGLGTAVRENGELKGHAAFNVLDGEDIAKIVTPFAFYQAASIALGQQFMREINENLKDINKKLDKILEHFENEKRAEILALINCVYLLNRSRNLDESDKIFLKDIKFKADRIRLYYFINFKNALKKDEENIINSYILTEKIMQTCDVLIYKHHLNTGEIDKAISAMQRLIDTEKILENDFAKISKHSQSDIIIIKRLRDKSKKIDDEYLFLQNFERKLFSQQNQGVYLLQSGADTKLITTE